jgi:hypothetical protein
MTQAHEFYPGREGSALERREAVLFSDILSHMRSIAKLLPLHDQPLPKRELIHDIGVLHWQRIQQTVALTVTEQRQQTDHQGYEVRCQLIQVSDDEYELDQASDGNFSISKPVGGDYAVFNISHQHGSFGAESDKRLDLTEHDLLECDRLSRDLAIRLGYLPPAG